MENGNTIILTEVWLLWSLLKSRSCLIHSGVDADFRVAHNATVELTCIGENMEGYYPVWYTNASVDDSMPNRAGDTGELISTLTINGNRTCGTINAYCRLHGGQIMHNTTLSVEG